MFRTDRHKAGANAVQDTRARRETGETSHNDITGEPSRTRGAVEHPYVNLANPMPAALDRVPPSHIITPPPNAARRWMTRARQGVRTRAARRPRQRPAAARTTTRPRPASKDGTPKGQSIWARSVPPPMVRKD